MRLTSENALDILKDYDVIVDGTDNFPTRYLVNDACVLLGKPNVYGSIFRFEGQVSVFYAEEGPATAASIPSRRRPAWFRVAPRAAFSACLPGTVGAMQATETIKLILGIGEPLIGRLLRYDALGMEFREFKLRKDPRCPVCGENATVTELIDYDEFCGFGGDHVEADEALTPEWEISAKELAAARAAGKHPVVIDVREPHEREIGYIPDSTLIPVGEVPARMHELNSADEIVLYCRTGVRSARALETLRAVGFGKLKNLVGGIHAWSDDVDPSIPKY